MYKVCPAKHRESFMIHATLCLDLSTEAYFFHLGDNRIFSHPCLKSSVTVHSRTKPTIRSCSTKMRKKSVLQLLHVVSLLPSTLAAMVCYDIVSPMHPEVLTPVDCWPTTSYNSLIKRATNKRISLHELQGRIPVAQHLHLLDPRAGPAPGRAPVPGSGPASDHAPGPGPGPAPAPGPPGSPGPDGPDGAPSGSALKPASNSDSGRNSHPAPGPAPVPHPPPAPPPAIPSPPGPTPSHDDSPPGRDSHPAPAPAPVPHPPSSPLPASPSVPGAAVSHGDLPPGRDSRPAPALAPVPHPPLPAVPSPAPGPAPSHDDSLLGLDFGPDSRLAPALAPVRHPPLPAVPSPAPGPVPSHADSLLGLDFGPDFGRAPAPALVPPPPVPLPAVPSPAPVLAPSHADSPLAPLPASIRKSPPVSPSYPSLPLLPNFPPPSVGSSSKSGSSGGSDSVKESNNGNDYGDESDPSVTPGIVQGSGRDHDDDDSPYEPNLPFFTFAPNSPLSEILSAPALPAPDWNSDQQIFFNLDCKQSSTTCQGMSQTLDLAGWYISQVLINPSSQSLITDNTLFCIAPGQRFSHRLLRRVRQM